MRNPIQISRYRPDRYIPHGLRFKLSKLRKIDTHLYSFHIFHVDYKYLDYSLVCSTQLNGVRYTQIDLTEEVDPDRTITSDDYIKGAVKGGCIKVRYYKPIHDVLFKWIPLKYETQVLLIADIGDDLWDYEE